ncbi:MAG: type II toxin-antitoxin system RelE/ParE family toxin [Cytophagales bacterium]|nr:type II toxin-antitoxin system RelE/ParE family toxin [Cytophagales bacterium]
MELKYSGQFNRDVAGCNRILSDEIGKTILKVKKAQDISQIQNLVKLRKYKVHYRIQIAKDYRIGVIIRGNKAWFMRFGHRNSIYKNFP